MSGRLAGLGVVLTRPRRDGERLARELEAEGAHAFVFPAIEIVPTPPSAERDAAIDMLDRAALAIFVSANAVEQGLAAVAARRPWPAGPRIAAIGDATAQALRNSGFHDVISPQAHHDSDGLLALPALQAVRGEAIIVFRGERGRERLKDVLESRGARVAYAECYRRVRPSADTAPLLAAWRRGEVHAVSALSAETLDHFVAMLGAEAHEDMMRTPLLVPHEAIAAAPAARRFARAIVTAPGARGLADALAGLRP